MNIYVCYRERSLNMYYAHIKTLGTQNSSPTQAEYIESVMDRLMDHKTLL